jgi:sulfite exporter TauE/SafE/plastocyanin domain-containing protein/copper chaperone CopZ
MTCVSCQNKIEKGLRETAGVVSAKADYSKNTVSVAYNTDSIQPQEIEAVITRLGYKVASKKQSTAAISRVIGVLIVLVAVFMLLQHSGFTGFFNSFPLAETGMGYGMLFIIGLVTSVHCVAMCGGINLSQCLPQNGVDTGKKATALRPSFLYNGGRVISYTLIGALVGALGSVISFSGMFKGSVQLIAGIFMIIMGINMLGLFPELRKLTPRLPRALTDRINAKKSGSKSPLIVGLLNGLMPCGPLQAMQLYALSTGSPTQGAIAMFLFSAGTVPLMFGLGALSSIMSRRFTRKVLTVGACLVVVLGLTMFSNGWNLSGLSGVGFADEIASSTAPAVTVEDGVQLVNSTLEPGRYPAITVRAGSPVKWTINAPEGTINGCNKSINIPEYNIEYAFQTGENVIEFTPEKTGRYLYSCWMGMIRGTITVVEEDGEIPADANESAAASEPLAAEDIKPKTTDYEIPVDEIAVAEIQEGYHGYQEVSLTLTDEGFLPAVIVVQRDLETRWNIDYQSSSSSATSLLLPQYQMELPIEAGENPVGLYPIGDFDFSTYDERLFGYVKVVDDVGSVDIEAIRQEIQQYRPQVWPPEYYQSGGCGGACETQEGAE